MLRRGVTILGFAFLLAFVLSPTATAQPYTVQWPQNSINWQQLQNLFSSYPGVSQFNIQFPNMTNWSVVPSQMQALYNSYTQQAGSLGYSSKMPNLSFSSLTKSAGLNGNNLTIPVSNAMSDMQLQAENLLEQMSQRMQSGSWMPGWMQQELNHIEDSARSTYYALPSWLRTGMELIYGYILSLCDFISKELRSLFR